MGDPPLEGNDSLHVTDKCLTGATYELAMIQLSRIFSNVLCSQHAVIVPGFLFNAGDVEKLQWKRPPMLPRIALLLLSLTVSLMI